MRKVRILICCLALNMAAFVAADIAPASARRVVHIGGAEVPYLVTWSEMMLKNGAGEPQATISATSYVREDVADRASRPVLIAFNGGPGASSSPLHFEILGPMRLTKANAEGVRSLVENAETLLDAADLVMVDPVGTGFSRELRPGSGAPYWSPRGDALAMETMIRDWLQKNGRTGSPLYIAGESYGVYRLAAMAQNIADLNVAGLILISGGTGGADGNENLVSAVCGMAAAAFAHGKIPTTGRDVEKAVEDARDFARREYVPALLAGPELPAAEKDRIAERLSKLIGLPAADIAAADLRLDRLNFQEALIPGMIVSSYDSRVAAPKPKSPLVPGRDKAADDPVLNMGTSNVIKSVWIRDYLRRDVGVKTDLDYISLTLDVNFGWNWNPGSAKYEDNMGFNATPSIVKFMKERADAGLLLLGGYYDLGVPIMSTHYTLWKAGVPVDRMKRALVQGGHTCYDDEASRKQSSTVIHEFIASCLSVEKPITDPSEDALRAAFAASLLGEGKKTFRRKTVIRGVEIDYDATLGAVALEDEASEPSAVFVYTAYTRRGVEDRGKRPVTFAWGGGPSTSSSGVHFDVLGPRRLVKWGTGGEPPVFSDNPVSVLDRSDLVMVDPVGTGFSVAAGKHQLWDFYSVDTDAASVAQFIQRYLKETGREGAPIYLLGRSYGTIRLPVVVHHLQKSNTAVRGAVFVSSALDGNTLWNTPGHIAPLYLTFPNFAAIAWYHHRQPRQAPNLETAIREARQFALNDLLVALVGWPDISPALREKVLDACYQFTGIRQDVWAGLDLRMSKSQFVKELLRDQNQVIRPGDARKIAAPAPAAAASPAVPGESFVNVYVREELGIAGAPSYRSMAPGVYNEAMDGPGPHLWDTTDHRAFVDSGGYLMPCFVNYLQDMAEAMKVNPRLRIQQHSGIYDLLCSSFPADWAMDRIDVPDELRGNIQTFDYASGHAVYLDAPEEFARFTANLAAFYEKE